MAFMLDTHAKWKQFKIESNKISGVVTSSLYSLRIEQFQESSLNTGKSNRTEQENTKWKSLTESKSDSPSFSLSLSFCLSNCLRIDRGQGFSISKSTFKYTLIRLTVSSLRIYLKAHLEMRMWHRRVCLWLRGRGPGFHKPHGTQNKYSKTFHSVVESPDWQNCKQFSAQNSQYGWLTVLNWIGRMSAETSTLEIGHLFVGYQFLSLAGKVRYLSEVNRNICRNVILHNAAAIYISYHL